MSPPNNMQQEDLFEKLSELGFARISTAIETLWGNKECETYMESLIISNRPDRQGFPVEVGSIILKLYNVHAACFKFADEADKWRAEPSRKIK